MFHYLFCIICKVFVFVFLNLFDYCLLLRAFFVRCQSSIIVSSDTESCLYSNVSLQGTCYSARSLIWINGVCLVLFVDTFHLKSIMSNIIPVSAI